MTDVLRVVSVSGGKDSTALYLWAIEQFGREGFRAVFADTGNEHPVTLNYVRNLHLMAKGPAVEWVTADFRAQMKRLLTTENPRRSEVQQNRVEANRESIEALGYTTGNQFLDMMIVRGVIPRAHRQFCTEELKMKPIREWLNRVRGFAEVRMYIGIRAEESERRSKLPEAEDSDFYDCYLERPLLRWSESQVWEMLEKHGVPPNPLYTEGGFGRVGCFPCIHITKQEIAKLPDWVFDKLAHWEKVMNHSWFVYKGGSTFPTLQEVREWAQTSRGGRQFDMFAPDSKDVPSCMSTWGACE